MERDGTPVMSFHSQSTMANWAGGGGFTEGRQLTIR
jgi:hypothetical protein